MRHLLLLLALLALPLQAQAAVTSSGANAKFRGIWLSTPYPAETVPAQGPIQLSIAVHNGGTMPKRIDVSVVHVPDGWTAELLGDSKPVSAVFIGPDDSSTLNLRLTPPKSIKAGTYKFALAGTASGGSRYELPVEITLGSQAPAAIKLEPEFPDLRGTPDSKFTYKVTLRNDSSHDELVRLDADTPPGFEATFNKEFDSQEITSIPVKAGSSEKVEIKVKPSQAAKANNYTIHVRAQAGKASAASNLTLKLTGRPELSLTGPDDRISGRAYAGDETPLTLVVANNGSAPARDVQLSSNEPSGWKIKFDQQKIAQLDPGQTREVKALITPSRQAVAGDYMVKLKAKGDAVSDSSDFRITVQTSTIWGAVGIGVIAAALMVLMFSMMRFGRR